MEGFLSSLWAKDVHGSKWEDLSFILSIKDCQSYYRQRPSGEQSRLGLTYHRKQLANLIFGNDPSGGISQTKASWN